MSADRDYWLEGRSNYLDGICPQAGRPRAGHPPWHPIRPWRFNDLKAWDSRVQGPGWLGALGNGEGIMGSRGLGVWGHGLGVLQGLWGRFQEARSWLGVGHGGLK